MKRLIVVLALTLAGLTASPAHAADAPPPGPVLSTQYVLKSMGYATPVTGTTNTRTTKAIAAWQAANGLRITGAPNVATLRSLGLDANGGALATSPAVRLTPPSVASGLHGLPYAPYALSECDEMTFYRLQFNLPARFDSLGWRESNCKNDVHTSCCYGYWQNYYSSHMSNRSSYAPFLREFCEIDALSDVFGSNASQKQKQACMTSIVFQISGFSPWSL